MEFQYTNLDIETQFPKLIRDRIPKIIAQNDKAIAKIRQTKDSDEYLEFVLHKVVEETVELQHSLEEGNMEEELADVYELLETLLKINKWSRTDIKKIQEEKNKKNGAFEKGYILEELKEK